MMRWPSMFVLFCMAASAAVPASAQNAASPAAQSDSDIVVTGRRTTKDEVRDFVGVLAEAEGGRQLARFETSAICPAALGLPPVQRELVVARLRKVAKAAGIAVAGAKCVPNAIVIVAKDRRALLEMLARDPAKYFPGMHPREVKRMIADDSPAIAWQVAGRPLNGDGREMAADPGSGMYVNETTLGGSRITTNGRPQISSGVVVVRADVLAGLTPTQLADYAAMRIFAGADPARLKTSTPPTILGIFNASADPAVPVTLTEWDLDLLRSFYAGPVNLKSAQQRSAIAQGMLKRRGSVAVD